MLLTCYRRIGRCLGRRNGDALLWHIDLKPHASGDFSIAVVQANSLLEDQAQVLASPHATLFGVYDGHGGNDASRFITYHLFRYLHEFASEQGGLSAEAIRRAFSATEEKFLTLVRRSWPAQPKFLYVGSCCLLGAIEDGVLYVANLGDSRAVLGRKRNRCVGVVAERLSTDHNVGDEEVRREVKAQHPDDPHIVVHCQGVWRIKGILQVSRSIGDAYLKKPDFCREPIFEQFAGPFSLKRPTISAEPSMHIRRLKQQDLFLIFASDGLWEQLSDETAVQIVFKNPRAGIAKRLVTAAIMEAAKKSEMQYEDVKRMRNGTRRRIHDDISVIVIYLDHNRGSSRYKGSTFELTSSPIDIFSHNAGVS